VFFLIAARDLNPVFPAQQALDGHLISGAGILESNSQSGSLYLMISDIFSKRAMEIQENYARMPVRQMQKISSVVAQTIEKEGTRSHRTYLLDLKRLIRDVEVIARVIMVNSLLPVGVDSTQDRHHRHGEKIQLAKSLYP